MWSGKWVYILIWGCSLLEPVCENKMKQRNKIKTVFKLKKKSGNSINKIKQSNSLFENYQSELICTRMRGSPELTDTCCYKGKLHIISAPDFTNTINPISNLVCFI